MPELNPTEDYYGPEDAQREFKWLCENGFIGAQNYVTDEMFYRRTKKGDKAVSE